MSAQEIPNLLSLRGEPRSRGRGRGRGSGLRNPLNQHSESASNRVDKVIQGTDTDAAVSRLSAVTLGYLDDPFARYFVSSSGTRRLPIINRGTYSRTTALDLLVDAFLSKPDECPTVTKQIISLGAGTDTRYFRLRARNGHQNVVYHEFDFPAVCAAKYRLVQQNHPVLVGTDKLFERKQSDNGGLDATAANAQESMEWGFTHASKDESSAGYICHPMDLRQLPEIHSLERFYGIRDDLPTLIISECCLCYLNAEVAKNVINWFTGKIKSVGLVLYEPIGVNDAFGQMMVENLASRGITMPTVHKYKTLEDQRGRLADLGFGVSGGGANAVSIEDVWDKWVVDTERERVDRLEGLDEVEEWLLLARHYAIVWGWNTDTGFEGLRELRPLHTRQIF
ncbi:leucine carboxyl methyltransferase 1 protein [Rutstroemia sp. NJR-2017a WRK4]|nr:leucine carboxyl methyltransferase 1 protein [Rutstroemia sp. NJR-2017a WRK4]